MLNAIGLANVGVEVFLKEKIPFLKQFNVPLICNIAASTIEEYVECTKILTTEDTIKAFEINVSCPNVKEGGLSFGNNINSVAKITERVRAVTDKPIIIKLSPNVSYIADFAKVAKENGADAVSAINTLVGAAFNIFTRKPKIHNVTGGFYDLILTDLEMPELSGLGLLHAIRRLEKGSGRCTPMVAITAADFELTAEGAAASGFDVHLLKPLDAELLRSKLKAFLRR